MAIASTAKSPSHDSGKEHDEKKIKAKKTKKAKIFEGTKPDTTLESEGNETPLEGEPKAADEPGEDDVAPDGKKYQRLILFVGQLPYKQVRLLFF